MGQLVNVALAVFEQFVWREVRRNFLAREALIGASVLVLVVGAGFLIAGGYLALEVSYGPPVAAFLVGAALCALAALILLAVTRSARRPAQLANLTSAAVVPAVAVGTVGRRDSQTILDEFGRILDSAGSLTAAFFFLGLSAGLIARWVNRRQD